VNTAPDQAQRERALDIDASFLVEAPAGSGKTELLTQRILALLARVERPEEILAITFTRKAASEMQQRVDDALRAGLQSNPPEDPHLRRRWQLARAALDADRRGDWQLLDNPGRVQIRTFDSFCGALTRRMPLLSQMGSGQSIVDDPSELHEAAALSLLAQLDGDSDIADELGRLLLHLDNKAERLQKLLANLLAKRENWMSLGRLDSRHRPFLEEHFQHVLDDLVADIHALLPVELAETLVEMAVFAAGNLAQEQSTSPLCAWVNGDVSEFPPGSDERGIELWKGLHCLLFTNKNELRKAAGITKKNGFPADKDADNVAMKARMKEVLADLEAAPQLCAALQQIQFLPSSSIADEEWNILADLTQVLPHLLAHLQLTFRESGQVDHAEIALRASLALGDDLQPSDLALHLDYRIRHILVDEFQDTSSRQWQLLEQLTRGWQSGDGRTMFCVGDAMQSIYGFRMAQVGLFLHAKQQGIGGIALEVLRLSANFRSRATLVEWNNSLFSNCFPKEVSVARGAVPFSPATAVRDAANEGPRCFGFGGEEADADEADYIAQRIASLQKEHPQWTIAVLASQRRQLHRIVEALQRNKIRYRAVDLEALASKPVVQDLLSLTRALARPADRIAWLSILRAPWCGLNLADLHVLANRTRADASAEVIDQIEQCLAENQTPEQCLSPDGHRRLQKLYAHMSLWLAQRKRYRVRDWVESCWRALGGQLCLQSDEEFDNAEAYWELLEEFDELNLQELQTRLAKLYARPDPQASESLQLMTIHKAKGLEFDVVFLPQLQSGRGRSDSELFLWEERLRNDGSSEWFVAATSETGSKQHPNYLWLNEESKKREQLERARLLYVACTRAREQLFLCSSLKEDKKSPGEWRAPSSNSMLSYLWPTFCAELELPTVSAREPTAAQQLSGRRLRTDATVETPTERLLFSHSDDEDIFRNEKFVFELQDDDARILGSVCHGIIHQMAELGWQQWWKDYRSENWLSSWRAQLLSLGMASAALDEALQTIRDRVEGFRQDNNLQWMFDSRHRQLKSEYEIHYLDASDAPRKYILDLVIVDDESRVHLIDFKFARPDTGQSLGDFLDQNLAEYSSIMQRYTHALEQLGYQKIRTRLYFPLLGEWAEYSV